MADLKYYNATVKEVNNNMVVFENGESAIPVTTSARTNIRSLRAGQVIRVGYNSSKREAFWLGTPMYGKRDERIAEAVKSSPGVEILPDNSIQEAKDAQAATEEILASPVHIKTESDMMAWGAAIKSAGQVFQGTGDVNGMLSAVEAAMTQRRRMLLGQ